MARIELSPKLWRPPFGLWRPEWVIPRTLETEAGYPLDSGDQSLDSGGREAVIPWTLAAILIKLNK
jgi:hypothetical protein